jgi:hypothetical protein
MPPIINEQTDELKARRQRRKGRQEPPAVNGGTPAGGQSAGAARDLLRGLITDGAPRNEEGSAASGPGSESKPAVSASGEPEDRTASESAPTTSRGGEAIDELIRRVKDNAAGAAVEASSTLQQRRPKGTADLARDAVTSRAARRRPSETELRSTDVAPTPKKRRRVVGAIVLLGGIAVLLVTLAGTGGTSVPRRLDSSTASSRLAAARSGDLGGALQATIAAIAPELRAVARRAASSARAAASRRGAKRRQIRSRAGRARSKHRVAVVRRAPVTNSPPPSTTGTQTQTSTAAQAPASTASQTSATSQPSAKSSSRPAGPTGSDPLGGIGSCVKGC